MSRFTVKMLRAECVRTLFINNSLVDGLSTTCGKYFKLIVTSATLRHIFGVLVFPSSYESEISEISLNEFYFYTF